MGCVLFGVAYPSLKAGTLTLEFYGSLALFLVVIFSAYPIRILEETAAECELMASGESDTQESTSRPKIIL